MLGCGASAQIVSSCLGVSEQYCNIYKKTQDKLCKLLKYNLPAPRAVALLSAQSLLSAPSGVRTLIPKHGKQRFFSKISARGIRTHESQKELCLSSQSTICALLHLYLWICFRVFIHSLRYIGQGC